MCPLSPFLLETLLTVLKTLSSGRTGLVGHALVNLLGIKEPLPATAPPLAFFFYCSAVVPCSPCPGASQFDVSVMTQRAPT